MKAYFGVFCGARLHTDEADRVFQMYRANGYTYVSVSSNGDGTYDGDVHLADVSARFDVTFESLEEAVHALNLESAHAESAA